MTNLHSQTLEAAKEYKSCEARLLRLLQEVDESKLFLKMGFGSLFVYITEGLALSEAVAFNLSTVARKSREIPALQVAVEAGLPISKARKIVPVLTRENYPEWIKKASTLPKIELEREVARVSPYVKTHESIRATGDNRCSMKLEISWQVRNELKRVQNLESNRNRKNISLEETLKELIQFYLERRDPLRRATRANARSTRALHAGTTRVIPRRLPSRIQHIVNLRDKNCCSYRSADGRICGSQVGVQTHHIQPWAMGGGHQTENLQSLCSAHHKFKHEDLTKREGAG